MLIDLPAYEAAMTAGELSLLAVGGGLYTVGAVIYALKRPNPWPAVFGYHEVFHTLVWAAALCHWVAVWLIAASSACSSARRPGPVWPTGRSRWRSAGSGGRPCAPAAR